MLDFVKIPAGRYLLGSRDFYPEESPPFAVDSGEFEMATTPVTNRQFATFVAATGWITEAEKIPLLSGNRQETNPGSMVFQPTDGPVDLTDWRNWWRWVPGASWKNPNGSGSSIDHIMEHPVTHVAYADALGFCEWAGVRLPSEVEWEIAARGGLHNAAFAWGDADQNSSNLLANTWQGSFPWKNTGAGGWRGTSPVATFPANHYGLFDMTGNVWEWTSSAWTTTHAANSEISSLGCRCGCSTTSSQAAMVIKGGSFLCSIDYCFRYRPAARSSQTTDSSLSHLGFRVTKINNRTNRTDYSELSYSVPLRAPSVDLIEHRRSIAKGKVHSHEV